MTDNIYLFHQTPPELAKELIRYCPLEPTDILLEPFKGEGAFYRHFPLENPKLWAEIEEGVDYTDISGEYDWVITNPPFRLDIGNKRVNSFWYLLDYYSIRAKKGIAFLANDRCFSTLTPLRLQLLSARGWSITKIVVCSVKKWRGRYFYVIFEKNKESVVSYMIGNY
jgi:hypothetical protein